jgi:phytoene dehydrogenase-like protein
MAKEGMDVLVLERRHLIGGAAVTGISLISCMTLAFQRCSNPPPPPLRDSISFVCFVEELHPGFKFSRASYVLSLLRPHIIEELQLQEHGLKWYMRNPYSFTPMRDGRSLLLGRDTEQNKKEIAKFSVSQAFLS